MQDDFSFFKDELKSRVDIADIVGEYVDLKKRGSNIVGLCPFHTEKTPSFSVNRNGQFYHCFGCGKGGDVFGFLMDITGMSFMEAVEHLAERTGMDVPRSKTVDPKAREQKELIVAANIAAGEYFHKNLYTAEGAPALEYLTGRELKPETIRAYRLGYSPETADSLLAFAKKKGISAADLARAGVLKLSDYGGSPYNRFGGRVIFPIFDITDRLVGFGGRILAGEGAKYLNTPETPVYQKSRVLFGIPQAKTAVKRLRNAIDVEGYMDVITLHQAGIQNAIAASGTAFTVEQGRILARMARNVVLLFDGDPAGFAAAARGANNLLSTDLSIGVAILPGGHDPDSFVREHGPDRLRELVDAPMDIWEFKLQALTVDTTDVQDRIKLAGEIADSISLLDDGIKRDLFIREMAPRIGVDVDSMRKAVDGRIRKGRKASETPVKREVGGRMEREILACILQYPGLARRFMEELGSKPFKTPAVKKTVDELFHRIVEGLDDTPSGLMSALDDREEQELVASVAVMEFKSEKAERFVEDSIRILKERELREEIERLSRESAFEKDAKRKNVFIRKRDKLMEELRKIRTT